MDYLGSSGITILQTGAPSFDNQTALDILESELGQPPGALFSFLSEDPIASASLGQVYFGILMETGQEVAVKVRHRTIFTFLPFF